MAPEADDALVTKTNSVDVWSLGCILYRMVAGSPLFESRREVFMYAVVALSPPLVVRKKGLSMACEEFLREVLQPSPGDRPSAEGCLNTAWIINKAPGSAHSIGRGLYTRLSEIKLRAPNIDTFSEMVADRAADSAHIRSSSAGDTRDWGVKFGGRRLWLLLDDERLTSHLGWTDLMLNYIIGHGAFGTIFLEKVQTRGMESPELWAVKRLSLKIPYFPAWRAQEEIKNSQMLSNVCFAQQRVLSSWVLVSFGLWRFCLT